ncbi:hypothetical protein [Streptomyces sp. H27-C3]|uniref:hypothetical protein n=1 Tax=Streptomyces sp. H27-C3 TaxID=3046305 RepID=UPI0024B92AA2|nr:hypothetical protein [Streptomyces sp. H27-C3]MDJ0461935.1 hypothetical protein [Streptomyces sp. H27-C3]
MAKRHIRAAAVCAIAVIALTGARGSRGGSCDSDSGSSGSSSSSGGHSNNGSGDSDSSTTSGGSTGEAGNVSRPAPAAGDVKIEDCVFKESEVKLVAKLRVTNTNSTSKTYDYRIEIAFKDAAGTTISTAPAGAKLASGASTTTEAITSHYDPEHKEVVARCEVITATKS